MKNHCGSNILRASALVALGLLCNVAVAETKAERVFLDRVKSVSTIDDALLTEDVLVIWPSPDVQSGLDYEAMGKQLCQEYKVFGYLVIWFMDSSKYRRDTEMVMLESYNCLEDYISTPIDSRENAVGGMK